MTASARPGVRAARHPDPAGRRPRAAGPPAAPGQPLALRGALAAVAAAGLGLAVITPLVLAGWIAAPHAGLGLPGALRTAAVIWLAAHHVSFWLRGVGRIGMLPLGLVLLPGALLWRAGRWLAQSAGVTCLRQVAHATFALALPYAVLSGLLAAASRSRLLAPSLSQAAAAAFVLAVCAGGLGAARALAPWGRVAQLLSPRSRSLVVGTAGSLVVLGAVGAVMVGSSLLVHLGEFGRLNSALGAGAVGTALLLLAQLAYAPNAIGWAVSFTLGPGFAFGTGTVVAPTGVALGPLPMLPMLAALPSGATAAIPGWASAAMLAAPYLAGAFGGTLLARVAPTPALEVAPLWGFACGAAAGAVTGVLAALSGGPLGSGRLAAVGPSGWQAGVVATLEVGVAAAVAAGIANWLRVRRDPLPSSAAAGPDQAEPAQAEVAGDGGDGHVLYLDPWADEADEGPPGGPGGPPISPSALP